MERGVEKCERVYGVNDEGVESVLGCGQRCGKVC